MMWLDRYCNWQMLRQPGIEMQQRPRIRGRIYVRLDDERSRLRIGNNVRINSGIIANPTGGTQMIIVVLAGGEVVIGDHAGMSNATLIARTRITLGEHVYLGAGCSLYDTDFHSVHHHERINRNSGVQSAPVTVGNRVFIGAHAIILKGVTIGDDAVIGAGAVVAKSVPAGEIWAGNPARFIRAVAETKYASERAR